MTEETRTTEFNAATVDEAVKRACANLGVTPGDISYEVLDTGSSGFMGIGARDARVSVTITSNPESEAEELEYLSEQTATAEPEPTEPPEEPQEISREPAPETEEPQEVTEQVSVPEDLIVEAREYVSHVTDLIDLDARVESYDAGEFVAVDVATEQAGLFIGQKGETIDALQYLLNVAVYRDREFSKRIVLDSEGYRQRRIEAIQGIAHRSARRAIREKRPIELPPMSPSERRVVHQYLQDEDRVMTSSEGRGDTRKVRVSPV